MRKLLLAATILAPFAITPAFAGGGTISGDINLAATSAASNAGVASEQGTMAGVKAAGTGGVIVGAVSGNYTAVETTAQGHASPLGSYTKTTAEQVNVGGTVAAGLAINKDGRNEGPRGSSFTMQSNNASGTAGGAQSSQAAGNSTATAANMNLGGFIKVETPRGHRGGPR